MGISGDTWVLVAAAVVLIVSHNLAVWTRQKELMKVNLSINEHLHGISHLVTEISLERRGSSVFEEINEKLKLFRHRMEAQELSELEERRGKRNRKHA